MPTTRDSTKHFYEVVPIVGGLHEFPHREVGNWIRESAGEKRSLQAALALMRERPEVQRVHVYHTHPSPGPVRRYMGYVMPGGTRIMRPW